MQIENQIHADATNLVLQFSPDETYESIFKGELLCPGGTFQANVQLIARVKLALTKLGLMSDQSPSKSGHSLLGTPKNNAAKPAVSPAVRTPQNDLD